MDIALFLFGTSHSLQCASNDVNCASVDKFETEVRRICADERIMRIVEEMSDSGLKHQGVELTIGKKIAIDLELIHQQVDLEWVERSALSLDDGTMLNVVLNHCFADGGHRFRNAFNALTDSVRECSWIGRTLSRGEWPVLFICGSNHVHSIESRWKLLELPITIIHEDYEP